MERGILRYVILDTLRDGPKHGYEIIKDIEERTQGEYAPSPGTLYPTLQYLDDLGLVESDQEDSRRVYRLTDAGRTELDEHAGPIEHFWSRFNFRKPSAAGLQELSFVRDALQDLTRTVSGGIRSAIFSGDGETLKQIRVALEKCQNEVREIVSQGAGTRTASDADAAPADGAGPDEFRPSGETHSL